jgi:hypothetical protein
MYSEYIERGPCYFVVVLFSHPSTSQLTQQQSLPTSLSLGLSSLCVAGKVCLF